MIGQEENLKTIRKWRLNRSFPKFIIICGDAGSGRFTLAKIISRTLNCIPIQYDNSISAVRECIEFVETSASRICCIFRDCDVMSLSAKNSLLKIVEEPPENAYFVMTIQNEGRMLETIKSRGTLLKMKPYSKGELRLKCENEYILDVVSNFGQLSLFDNESYDLYRTFTEDLILALLNNNGAELMKSLSRLSPKNKDLDFNRFYLIFKKEFKKYNELCSIENINELVNFDEMFSYKSINQFYLLEKTIINIYLNMKLRRKD